MKSIAYSTEQIRALDAAIIATGEVSAYQLMTAAAEAALATINRRWASAKSVAIVCGAGNNAGDGYLLAGLLKAQGVEVEVFALADPDSLAETAANAFSDWRQQGGSVTPVDSNSIPSFSSFDLLVDAICGVGINRPLEGAWLSVVEAINQRMGEGVLALDLPSGLDADTGSALGGVVIAEATVTFVGSKVGLHTGVAADFAGEVELAELVEASSTRSEHGGSANLLDTADIRRWIAPRGNTRHKGQNGHLLIVGGNLSMSGAVRLAGEAALRAGAGLVTIATHPSHAAEVDQGCPEVMALPVVDAEDFKEAGHWASVMTIGPGLGQSDWAQYLYHTALATGISRNLPMIVDADALGMLAKSPQRYDNWVLTPHAGEAARLLGCTSAEVQADRLSAAQKIAEKFGGVVVLKGPGTVVASAGHKPNVITCGNGGMAVGGMGDVLSGVISAMLADEHSIFDAASCGAVLHSAAGDVAAGDMPRGMLPSDLFQPLRELVNLKGL